MSDILPSEYKGWLVKLVPAAGVKFDVDLLWRMANDLASTQPQQAIAMLVRALDMLDGRILDRVLTKDPPIEQADVEMAGGIISRMRRSLADQTASLNVINANAPAFGEMIRRTVFNRTRRGYYNPNNPTYYGGPDDRLPPW